MALVDSLVPVHQRLASLGKRLGLPSHNHIVTTTDIEGPVLCSLNTVTFASVSMYQVSGLVVEARDVIAADIDGNYDEATLRGAWYIDGVRHTVVTLTRRPTSYTLVLRPLVDRRGGPLL